MMVFANFSRFFIAVIFAILTVLTVPKLQVNAQISFNSAAARGSDGTLGLSTSKLKELRCFPNNGVAARSLSELEVKLLQRNLNFQGQQAFGAKKIPVDGIWGKKTFEAVRQWEKYVHFSKYSTFAVLTKETLRSLGVVC